MELTVLGVTLVTTIILLLLGERNISASEIFPSRKRAHPALIKVRRQDRPNRRLR